MHEGKHGILDGVDDIDDLFGKKKKDEKTNNTVKDHDCEEDVLNHEHKHDHNDLGKTNNGCGCSK